MKESGFLKAWSGGVLFRLRTCLILGFRIRIPWSPAISTRNRIFSRGSHSQARKRTRVNSSAPCPLTCNFIALYGFEFNDIRSPISQLWSVSGAQPFARQMVCGVCKLALCFGFLRWSEPFAVGGRDRELQIGFRVLLRLAGQGRLEQIFGVQLRFRPVQLVKDGDGLALLTVLIKPVGPEPATAAGKLVNLESRRCGSAWGQG